MKKIIGAAMILIAVASVSYAQYTVINKRAGMMVEGRPFFTDAGVYNGYHLAGSPLGWFDIDSTSRLSADVGYRTYSLGDESGNYLSGQTVRMGEPGTAYFEVFYGPEFLSHDNSQAADQPPASLTLQCFGLTLAAQSQSGSFRSSLSAAGSVGNQKWKDSDSSRTLWTLERLRLDMGSRVHPLARVGLYIGATLHYDTLYNPTPISGDVRHEDRGAQMNLPEFGGNIDFGNEGFPVRANISMSYATSYFLYTAKPHNMLGGGTPTLDGFGNANAIINDSLNFFALAQGFVPINEEYQFSPGLLFGLTNNSGKERTPHERNDSPFEIGDPVPNRDYTLSGVHFGIGTGFEAKKYADIYTEYSFASMSLECGTAHTQPNVKKRMLHHVSFGASTSLQKFVELPLDITPRMAYFISGSAGAINAVHSDLRQINITSGKSKRHLYEPHLFLEDFATTSGFTFGIDGKTLDDRITASFYTTFLSKKFENAEPKGGFELGLSAGIKL